MNTGKIVFGPTHNMLGFESLFDELDHFVNSNNNKNNGYPPYNLSRVGEDQYLVEIAVAGFSQDELEIFVKDGYLTVKGEKVQKEDTGNYLYKGIGTRNFTKSFKIADTINVIGASIQDGVLSVALVNIIPEHRKERRIEIGTVSKQQLLTEADKSA